MIHLIKGNGKGKTTASVGLSVRAAGHGFKVLFIQFLKDESSGEITVLKKIPEITVMHAPVNYGFTFNMTEEQKEETAKEYEKLIDKAISSDAFIIVLDEVLHALNAGMIKKEQIQSLLEKEAEIVLTGWDAPDWLIERADYISDIQNIRNPYNKGMNARIGIEY